MLASATRRVAPAAFSPTRRGAANGSTRAVVRSVTRLGLARSLRSLFSRAGTATRCIQTLVAWSSKAVPCPLPAARSRSLLHRAGHSARAATAAPRRCFVSASVLHRSERFRRGCRAGWRSAIPSTPRSSSTSSAGPVATSAEQRWPPEPRGHDMLTHRPAAAPLMSKSSGVVRTQPAPLDSHAQRPRVLARASHVTRQMSLFGRPGETR